MKSFEEFRNNWLTPQVEKELMQQSLNQTNNLTETNESSFIATFSATYSLLLLAEYHEWLNS